jgi:hypothetical protein
MEKQARVGCNCGKKSNEAWGGLDVVLLLGDDNQLPPVGDTPLGDPMQKSTDSAASKHGAVVYSEFKKAVELDQIMRQDPEEFEFCDCIATQLCDPEFSVQDRDWNWCNSRRLSKLPPAEAEQFEDAMALFPTHELKDGHNLKKLQGLNAVATVKAQNKGKHSKSDSVQGLPKTTYLGPGARVMMTNNLYTEWGLFNGAIGEVVDVVYATPQGPGSSELPKYVTVRYPHYIGPAWIQSDPTLVPVPVTEKKCDRHCCSRSSIPLVPAWALTIHKCQGMTIGENEPIKKAAIYLGKPSMEKRSPGLMNVALSRGRKGSDIAFLDDVINKDRLEAVRKSAAAPKRHWEIQRLRGVSTETLKADPDLANYQSFIDMVNGIYRSANKPELQLAPAVYAEEPKKQADARAVYDAMREQRLDRRKEDTTSLSTAAFAAVLSLATVAAAAGTGKGRKQKKGKGEATNPPRAPAATEPAALCKELSLTIQSMTVPVGDSWGVNSKFLPGTLRRRLLATSAMRNAQRNFAGTEADPFDAMMALDDASAALFDQQLAELDASSTAQLQADAIRYRTLPGRAACVLQSCLHYRRVSYFCPNQHEVGDCLDHPYSSVALCMPPATEPVVTVGRLVDINFRPGDSNSDGDYKCSLCNKKQKIRELSWLERPPATLVLQVKPQRRGQLVQVDFEVGSASEPVWLESLFQPQSVNPGYALIAGLLYRQHHYVAFGRQETDTFLWYDSLDKAAAPSEQYTISELKSEINDSKTEEKKRAPWQVVGLWYRRVDEMKKTRGVVVQNLTWHNNNCYLNALLTCLAYTKVWSGTAITRTGRGSSSSSVWR